MQRKVSEALSRAVDANKEKEIEVALRWAKRALLPESTAAIQAARRKLKVLRGEVETRVLVEARLAEIPALSGSQIQDDIATPAIIGDLQSEALELQPTPNQKGRRIHEGLPTPPKPTAPMPTFTSCYDA